MATVSSHILDSVSGLDAAGIRCELFRLRDDGAREPVFDLLADDDGRIGETVTLDDDSSGSEFELVIHGAEYFRAQGVRPNSKVEVVVLRFRMDDDGKRYHMPVMLAPHSYSTWWSE